MSDNNKPLTEDEVQTICRKLVDREVIHCVSTLVYELSQRDGTREDCSELWQGQPSYGEYTCPKCGNRFEDQPEDGRPCLQVLPDHGGDCQHELSLAEDFEPTEWEEVFEHWVVSEWLADKLEVKGETIVRDFFGLTIWGRATTGQAIMLDSVIRDIAKDAGILESPLADSWL